MTHNQRFVLVLAGMLLAGVVLMRTAPAQQPPPAKGKALMTSHLADEREIIRVVDEIDNTVDAKNWAACRSHFTDEIDVDFSSLAGGKPARIKADQLVGGWQRSLYADKKSHHMRTNHRVSVNGDRATVFSKGYAFNLLPHQKTGSDLWEVWGDYQHAMERGPQGWKCAGMTLVVTHARGNEKARDFVPAP